MLRLALIFLVACPAALVAQDKVTFDEHVLPIFRAKCGMCHDANTAKGGLTLDNVNITAAMGEHRIDFREPLAEDLRRLRLNTSMGNVIVENLGNARAEVISATGSMGNLTATLGGDWQPGTETEATFEQSMGELTVRVPSNIRVEADVRSAQGETTRSPEIRQLDAKLADPDGQHPGLVRATGPSCAQREVDTRRRPVRHGRLDRGLLLHLHGDGVLLPAVGAGPPATEHEDDPG